MYKRQTLRRLPKNPSRTTTEAGETGRSVREREQARSGEMAALETEEAGTLIKTIRKIIRITAAVPIILKVIEVTVDSVQIARRNLKAD